jgi:uncharacterized membrane-anchored protein
MANRNLVLLAVALPVLLLAGGIARSEYAVRNRPTFRFAVEGYDPRDLLRGRYLQYRVELEQGPALDACDESLSQSCCLCVERGTDASAAATVQRGECSSVRARCDAALDAHVYDEPQRHYISELAAPELERRFIEAAAAGKAFVVVSIDAEGQPHVQHLELFGEALR